MASALPTYIRARWHGHTPLSRLLWLDVWGVGTLVNGVFVFATFLLYAKRADPALAMAVHLVPLPLNLFLVAAVWRHPAALPWAKALVLFWLALTLLI
jgi:hypothetical protein